MNITSIRNIVIAAVIVVVGLIVLGFFSTLLSAIVPITIAAVIGFILGRMSVNVNLLSLLTRRRAEKPAETPVPPRAEKIERTAEVAAPAVKRAAERATERLAEQEAPKAEEEASLDFEVKTEDQLKAEARRLEEEVAKRNAAYDARAAIEERKKRLLGDKPEQ